MRQFGRFRCASANSRSATSLVAPASASIGPVASAPSLGAAPDSNSRPISFAISAMAFLGIILGSSDDEADYDPSRHRAAATYGTTCSNAALHAISEIRRVRRFESVRRDAVTRANWAGEAVGNRIDSVMAFGASSSGDGMADLTVLGS